MYPPDTGFSISMISILLFMTSVGIQCECQRIRL